MNNTNKYYWTDIEMTRLNLGCRYKLWLFRILRSLFYYVIIQILLRFLSVILFSDSWF